MAAANDYIKHIFPLGFVLGMVFGKGFSILFINTFVNLLANQRKHILLLSYCFDKTLRPKQFIKGLFRLRVPGGKAQNGGLTP